MVTTSERLSLYGVIGLGALFALVGVLPTGGPPIAVPSLRLVLFVGMALAGLWLMRGTSLTIAPRSWDSGLAVPLLSAIGVALIIVSIERIFDEAPPLADIPPGIRLMALSVASFSEEIVWRLFAMTLVIRVLARAFGTSTDQAGIVWTAIVLAQIGNVVAHLGPPQDAVQTLHDAARYVAPGMVWGWLYARHGLLSAQVGHVGCHVMMAPFVA